MEEIQERDIYFAIDAGPDVLDYYAQNAGGIVFAGAASLTPNGRGHVCLQFRNSWLASCKQPACIP